MTRKVVYLTDEGATRHGEHLVSIGHTGKAGGLTETEDAGVALPEGAEVGSVQCIECGADLTPGRDYKVVEKFGFEVTAFTEEDKSRDPWYQDPSAWQG
jgi:hypothetical protein